jgi:hypothetical protein
MLIGTTTDDFFRFLLREADLTGELKKNRCFCQIESFGKIGFKCSPMKGFSFAEVFRPEA